MRSAKSEKKSRRETKILVANLEYGAQKTGLEPWLKLLHKEEENGKACDVLILSETWTKRKYNSGRRLALQKKFYWVGDYKSGLAIVSRWPLTLIGVGECFLTAHIPSRNLIVAVIHLPDFPYAPWQITGEPYCYSGECQPSLLSPKQAVTVAKQTRLPHLREALGSVEKEKGEKTKVVVAGDFNEPSHLDWTKAATKKGLVPAAIKFPCSVEMLTKTFKDAFRETWPDETTVLGYTWGPQNVNKEKEKTETKTNEKKKKRYLHKSKQI